MKITFDTNALSRVAQPDLFPKDASQPDFFKINAALKANSIAGAFSETVVTIEGMRRVDRAPVFAGTRLRPEYDPVFEDEHGNHVMTIKLNVEQPERKPVPVKFGARVSAAITLGLKMMRAPRIALTRIEDPDKTLFIQDVDEAAMSQRHDRFCDALRAIEARGVGMTRLKGLASQFAARAGVTEPWFKSVGRANGIHEERAVERAFAEWSDADSVATHISYAFDFFCSTDFGKAGSDPSVFDPANRAWLEQTYSVKFIMLSELAAMV